MQTRNKHLKLAHMLLRELELVYNLQAKTHEKADKRLKVLVRKFKRLFYNNAKYESREPNVDA